MGPGSSTGSGVSGRHGNGGPVRRGICEDEPVVEDLRCVSRVTATVTQPGRRVLLPFTVTKPEQVSIRFSASTFDGSTPGDSVSLADRTRKRLRPGRLLPGLAPALPSPRPTSGKPAEAPANLYKIWIGVKIGAASGLLSRGGSGLGPARAWLCCTGGCCVAGVSY